MNPRETQSTEPQVSPRPQQQDQRTSLWFGVQSFQQGLALQQQARQRVESSESFQILGMEHEDVLTLGVRCQKSEERLKNDFSNIVKVKRGGEATIHNRGQLVIYPVVNLRALKWGARDYVEALMLATEDFFMLHNVAVVRQKEPGLYTAKGKVAFFGVQISRGITGHGLAINVSNDLRVFAKIPVCGVSGQSMDRLQEYKPKRQILSQLFEQWSGCFKRRMVTVSRA